MNCFDCGDEGHLARDCPNNAFTSGSGNGPPYCGICDQRTRQIITADGRPARCPECHPLRHQHLKHIRRCPGCKMLVHEWDNAPCGQHSSPVAKDNRPTKEHIRETTGRTP